MRVRFIGDPNDDFSGPDVLLMGGEQYPRDEWVEVTDDRLAARLEGNSHFDVDYGDEVATDGSMITDMPKRKGWPKGKPRGPRKMRNENAKEQS